jgi:hypothetical protein
MTRNEIIERLYLGKSFRECISKMEPDHLRDDLRQEVAVVVCEWPDEKVIDLYEKGVLDFYVVRVILNMIKSNTSPFYKKYRQIVAEFGEVADKFGEVDQCHADRLTREALEDFTIEQIDEIHWYNSGLVRLYLQLGNYRAIEKETKIPFPSCYKTIQKSIEELRRRAMIKVLELPKENRPLFAKGELSAISQLQLKL